MKIDLNEYETTSVENDTISAVHALRRRIDHMHEVIYLLVASNGGKLVILRSEMERMDAQTGLEITTSMNMTSGNVTLEIT